MRSTACTDVVATIAALTGTDLDQAADDQIHDDLQALLPALNQLTAHVAGLTAAFHRRELAQADAHRGTRDWLCAYGRISPHTATTWLRRGELLHDLPAVAAAMTAGDVNPDHLRPIDQLTRHVGPTQLAPFAGLLADLATTTGPAEVARACQRIREHLDPDGPDPDPDAGQRRCLTLSRSGSLFSLHGRLDLDSGAAVLTALDAMMTAPGPGDDRTAAQRRADALTDLCTQALTHHQVPTVGGQRPHLGLLITPDALLAHSAVRTSSDPDLAIGTQLGGPDVRDEDAPPIWSQDDDDRCHANRGRDPLGQAGIPPGPEPPWLTWAGHVPTALAQRIACDCDVWRAVLDPATGLPLEVGRAHRIVPHWIRKALHARDRGCRWPGCLAHPNWTDAHHLIEWYYGGETNVDNLLLLCRFHHTRVHEGQWTIRLDPTTGEVAVTRPDGTPYELGPSQPWRPPVARPVTGDHRGEGLYQAA